VLQYTDWEHLGDGYINQKKIAEIVGDCFFICPTNLFAEKFAEQGTTVYYYYFTQVRPAFRLSLSSVALRSFREYSSPHI
jgi:acetylcholinesterase